jgi:hypothetical protein
MCSSMIDKVFELLSFENFDTVFFKVNFVIFIDFERLFDFEIPDTRFWKLGAKFSFFFMIFDS